MQWFMQTQSCQHSICLKTKQTVNYLNVTETEEEFQVSQTAKLLKKVNNSGTITSVNLQEMLTMENYLIMK
jgi:hypothetical protein